MTLVSCILTLLCHHHLSWSSSFLCTSPVYSVHKIGSTFLPKGSKQLKELLYPTRCPLPHPAFSQPLHRLTHWLQRASPPLVLTFFHKLIFLFLPLNVSDVVNLSLTYFFFYILYSLWTSSSTSAFNQCPHTDNSHILHKCVTTSNLCVQPWSMYLS